MFDIKVSLDILNFCARALASGNGTHIPGTPAECKPPFALQWVETAVCDLSHVEGSKRTSACFAAVTPRAESSDVAFTD